MKLLNDIQFNASKAQMTLESRKGSSLSIYEVQSKVIEPIIHLEVEGLELLKSEYISVFLGF